MFRHFKLFYNFKRIFRRGLMYYSWEKITQSHKKNVLSTSQTAYSTCFLSRWIHFRSQSTPTTSGFWQNSKKPWTKRFWGVFWICQKPWFGGSKLTVDMDSAIQKSYRMSVVFKNKSVTYTFYFIVNSI